MTRRWPWLLLAGYVLVVAWILLNPVGDVSRDGSALLVRWSFAIGLPDAIAVRAEFWANIVIIAPLPILGSLAIGRRRVGTWVVVAFVGSTLVEAVQRFVFTDRVGDYRDIVANTLGALVGSAIVSLVASIGATQATERHDDASTS